jgi:Domain of unknown function (DUF4160)
VDNRGVVFHANHQRVLWRTDTDVFQDIERHHLPYIHVRYQGEEATVSISDGLFLDGNLPPKQLKMSASVDRNTQGRTSCGLGTGCQW